MNDESFAERIWSDLPEEVTGGPLPIAPKGLHRARVFFVSNTRQSEDGNWTFINVGLEVIDTPSAPFFITLFHPTSEGLKGNRERYTRAVAALNSFLYATQVKVEGGTVDLQQAVGKEVVVAISHTTNKVTGSLEPTASFRGPAPSSGGAEAQQVEEDITPPF